MHVVPYINERSQGGGEREPFARKPVAPVTKIVLFSKNWSIPSNSMRGKKTREGESK